MHRFLALSVAALSLLAAQSSLAFTVVAGDVSTDVKVEDVTTVAAGFLAEAETSIGSINDGSIILGDASMKVEAEDVTTVAAGFLAEACTSIGSVGGC